MRAAKNWSTVGGLRVYWRALGRSHDDALPLVCVHGAVIAGAYLLPLASRLARDRTVIVPDLPGYGRSEHPRRVLDVPALAESLLGFLDAVALPRVALLGHSLGTQVAAHLAAAHPGRVERLVLVAPTVDPSIRTRRQLLWRLLRDAPRERGSLVRLELRDLRRCGLRRAFETLRVTIEDEVEAVLPAVGVPSLVVRGERDPLVSRRWTREVARLLPDARAVEISGGTHAVNYGQPRAVAEVVRGFLLGATVVDASGGEAA